MAFCSGASFEIDWKLNGIRCIHVYIRMLANVPLTEALWAAAPSWPMPCGAINQVQFPAGLVVRCRLVAVYMPLC